MGGVSDRPASTCASPWRCGTARTRSSRNVCSAWAGPQGNHAEDVKECYYYLDSTPTHAYMKYLYKYPQAEFPYARWCEANRSRTKPDRNTSCWHTGIFDENRYFDVYVEYAKDGPEDAADPDQRHQPRPRSRPAASAAQRLVPQYWSWTAGHANAVHRKADLDAPRPDGELEPLLPPYRLDLRGLAELLFTENETNRLELCGAPVQRPVRQGRLPSPRGSRRGGRA
jgi:hypothetical protein